MYDADGSLRGELAYVFEKLVRRRHCSLCDITHGALKRRSSFDRAVTSLGAPVVLVHRDELDPDVAAAVGSAAPCVLARTANGLTELADADELASCGADPDRFVGLLRANAEALDLQFGQ